MKRIICHGDSLTEGADVTSAQRWPNLLQDILGIDVLNSGIGGDSTAGMLSRFPNDVVMRKPDAVILMGGTNDFWWNLPGNVPMANLFTMVYQAQYHGIIPILGLPIPFDIDQALKQSYCPPEGGYARQLSKLESLVSQLKTYAENSDIGVLDFHDLFMDGQARIRTERFLEDGVHPNAEGHQCMAKLAAAMLCELKQ